MEGGVGSVICIDGVGGPSEEDMGGKRETPGDRLITDWATAAWSVHDNRAQARPAYTEKGEPENRAAKRNNCERTSFPSRFTVPVDSRTRAEKS